MSQPEDPDLTAQYDRFRHLMIVARKLRNLTQREVAARMGRPQSFLGKFENGTRGLDVVEFVAVARAIGVDPRRIVTKLLKTWPEASAQPQPPTEPPRQEPA
jgi:transcriptional regulator with XRE-family HTH domain